MQFVPCKTFICPGCLLLSSLVSAPCPDPATIASIQQHAPHAYHHPCLSGPPGLVCEYIRDVSGKVYLLSVLRTEWASNSNGHGAGSLSATALLLIPEGDESRMGRQTSTSPPSAFRHEEEEARRPGTEICTVLSNLSQFIIKGTLKCFIMIINHHSH